MIKKHTEFSFIYLIFQDPNSLITFITLKTKKQLN